jgi:PAS domain S-box-containing protein
VTKEPGTKHFSNSYKILLVGIVIAVFFWIFDSVVDTLIFKEGDFVKNLLAPGVIEFWMRIVIMVMIIGMSFYARDLITGRTLSEEALRESEKKYKNLATNAPVGIYKSNLKGDIIYVNEALSKMLGYGSPEELMSGGAIERYKNPEDRNTFIDTLKKSGELKGFELEVVTKTGQSKNVLISATLEGETLTGMIIDITEHKRADEALQAAIVNAEGERARSEAIIAGIGEGISIQDTDFKILYQNQVHKDIIGDHVGDYCYRAYERNDSVCEGCPVAMTFEDGEIHTVERRVDLDDRILYVEITASPLKDASGKIIRGIEVVRDITERKTAEDKLRASEEKYRTLAETLTEVVYRANPETYETTYINSAIKSISGYTQEEWLGDPSSWANTIHPEDRVRVLSLLTDAKGRLKNLNLVYRVIRKDKSVGWVENRMTWEKDQRGKVVAQEDGG